MKRLYLILTLIVCAFVTSCRNSARFEITNQTSDVIDSIYLQPSQEPFRKFISLMPNETKGYDLDMSKVSGDGIFGIIYKQKSITKTVGLEYYSNGNPPERLIKLFIHPDIVISR